MRRPGFYGNANQQNFEQNYRKRQLINPSEIVVNYLRMRLARKKFLYHLGAYWLLWDSAAWRYLVNQSVS
jgi:hypothetical protein